MEFTHPEVKSKYRCKAIVNAGKATPKGSALLSDITPAIAAYLVQCKDPDIEEIPAATPKRKAPAIDSSKAAEA